ncbi:epithelial cell-transforming sequence 2 oncogene-like [Ambystoma mexicanum]|uniref:epithelial cell-transforming sequence 2 oncogene-like n=1 Tax=Ambystoma mexicanum TaxID=8296 RepID=UPI0037E974E7
MNVSTARSLPPAEQAKTPRTMVVGTRASPHSVKRWQLESVGLSAGEPDMSITEPTSIYQSNVSDHTKFSAWTPIASQTFNKQLFNERINLVSHWFDLWTDKQRKHFLYAIFARCSKSQLRFVQNWFTEVVPVTKLDFTTVLPRFISLYIFSFLNPQELCAAGQVNWHWKFLTEQDCLWIPKCTKFGWFLPYAPSDNEYSAWKQHYIACATSLDYITPREAADVYGTLHELKEACEEEDEKLGEILLRTMLRERLALHKKELLKSRPPWMSRSCNPTLLKSSLDASQYQAVADQTALREALWQIKGKGSPSNLSLSKQLLQDNKDVPSISLTLEKQLLSTSVKDFHKRKTVAGSNSYPVLPNRQCQRVRQKYGSLSSPAQPHLVLISSRIPAFEVVMDSVKPSVVSVVYDHSGMTLESLLFYVEKALDGRRARSIGIVADGDCREIHLLRGCRIGVSSVLSPEVREFWEKLGGCVVSQEEEGQIHLFVPLAASEEGMEMISKISQLTGVLFSTPTGIATGSYQHIMGEWLGTQRFGCPPLLYFSEVKLQIWCRLADLLEEAIRSIRKQMRPYIQRLQKTVSGRIIGQFMYDSMSMAQVQTNRVTAQALADGLVELSRQKHENPLEFLALFLLRKGSKNNEFKKHIFLTEFDSEETLSTLLQQDDAAEKELSPKGKCHNLRTSDKKFEKMIKLERLLQGDTADKRNRFAQEILKSERIYVQMLTIVRDVYVVPLKAALASNRAILSIANVQIIFSDVLEILQLNRLFLDELMVRLQEWGPAQCLGDVFTKFGSRLKTYTNFFNNYTVILKTIDKCRETVPSFRAFLKRHEKTVSTKMMTLQELLLCPASRFEQYVDLLYAVRLHTPAEHADREDLTAAIKQLKHYRDYISQLKLNLEKDVQMENTQKIIQGCPNLLEANRHLIRVQDVALLSCRNEEISASLRVYEHINDLTLFLFNDALVLTSRSISYTPFQRTSQTAYQFLASVALHRLLQEDIPDSKYVKDAFILQGPKRKWICSVDNEEEKFAWLSVAQSAISASIAKK